MDKYSLIRFHSLKFTFVSPSSFFSYFVFILCGSLFAFKALKSSIVKLSGFSSILPSTFSLFSEKSSVFLFDLQKT